MQIIMRILAVAGAALAPIACGEDISGEKCGDGTFEMTPQAATACPQGTECGDGFVCDPDDQMCKRPIERGVCYHSMQDVPCGIWNYRIAPRTDFEDYIDIFWGDGCDPNNFDGSFEEAGVRYTLSGTPTAEPPTGPSGGALMISGNYTTDTGEQGTFDLFW